MSTFSSFRPSAAPTRRDNLPGIVSLDVYRERRAARTAALHGEPPQTISDTMYEDHRIAFISAARQHERRALTLLLNGRSDQAALHHLTAQLFRVYAVDHVVRRLAIIACDAPEHRAAHTVHRNATLFFRAIVEAFFREHAVEARGDLRRRLSVADDIAEITSAFRDFGFERRYNAVVSAFNAQARRSDRAADDVLMQLERSYRPYLN